MTIICWRDGILAADSAAGQGDLRVGRTLKIMLPVRGFDGTLPARPDQVIAWSGNVTEGPKFCGWAEDGFPSWLMPAFSESFEGIFIERGRHPRLFDETGELAELIAPFLCLGNGSFVAIGAMAAGADAIRACEIACDWIDGCRPPIISVDMRAQG